MLIMCKQSAKSGKTYLVLCFNNIYVSFDRMTIERVALTNGISNIDLNDMNVGDIIKLKEV